MPPVKDKDTPAPAIASDGRKTADALWLFEQFMHCDPPLILNVVGIAEATGFKPNSIVKRINTLQHRYPGFGIRTRTAGPRQSSNLIVASPKVDAKSPIKKATNKNARSKVKDVPVESAESDEEEHNRRRTRLRGQIGQVRTDDEVDGKQPRRPTRASTIDNLKSKKETVTAPEAPRTVAPKKATAPPEESPEVEEHESDAEADDEQSELPVKQAVTPKTRGGRKSAGLGTLANPIEDLEKPAPRGRHASSRKGDLPGNGKELIDQVANGADTTADDAEPKTTDVVKNSFHALNPGTKRKRSATPDAASSPLTPLPDVRKRLYQTEDNEQDVGEMSQSSWPRSPALHPLKKKIKPNEPFDKEVATRAAILATADDSSNAQWGPGTQSTVTGGSKVARTKEAESELGTAQSSGDDPDITAQQDRVNETDLVTPQGRSIDEMSTDGDTDSSNNGLEAENSQVIRLPESPSAGRESPVKQAIRPESTSLDTKLDSRLISESRVVEAGPDPEMLPSYQDSSPQGAVLRDRATPDEISSGPTSSTVTIAEQEAGEGGEEAEQPERPAIKSRFSRPLQWMQWVPKARPSKDVNTA